MPAVAADDATPDTADGRYIFNKIADGGGLLRLDTQTGEVALCSQRSVGWACEAAPEDRAVLENEIARLRSENAALKKDILSRGLPLPPGAMPESARRRTASRKIASQFAIAERRRYRSHDVVRRPGLASLRRRDRAGAEAGLEQELERDPDGAGFG